MTTDYTYSGPFLRASTPAQGIFDDFLAIPTTQKDLSSRSLSDLVLSLNFINPPRGVPTRLVTCSFGNADVELTQYVIQRLLQWDSSHSILAALIDAFVNRTNVSPFL